MFQTTLIKLRLRKVFETKGAELKKKSKLPQECLFEAFE